MTNKIRRRGYLKYYSGSMQGDTFQQCITDKKPEAILLFLYILEQINAQDLNDELSGKCVIDVDIARRVFNIKTPSLLSLSDYLVATNRQLTCNLVGSKLHLFCANYAEYQERRGQKTCKNDANPPNNKELRIKNKEIRKEIIKKSSLDANDTHSIFSPEDLLKLFNEGRNLLPECRTMSDSRKRKASAQIRKYPDPGHWKLALEKFCASDFCNETWRPGFDDLLNETKRLRAIEGAYDNNNKNESAKRELLAWAQEGNT